MQNTRAIAAGLLPLPGNCLHKDFERKSRYSQKYAHTVSAFPGCSGAMVACWAEDMKTPKVIGLGEYTFADPMVSENTNFKPGIVDALLPKWPANAMVGFTQATLEWFGSVCH